MLEQHETLETLKLKSKSVGDEGIHSLAESLKVNVTLKKLILNLDDNTRLSEQGTKDLFQAVKARKGKDELQTLEEFFIMAPSSPDKAKTLVYAVHATMDEPSADLSGKKIKDFGKHFWNGMLWQNDKLEILKLIHCEIGDSDVKFLAAALKGNEILKKLHLHDNDIKAEGAMVLAEAVKEHCSLEELYVANYPQEKAKDLVAAVKNDREGMEELDLHGQEITDFGAFFLAGMLQQEPDKLKTLKLHDNPIQHDGAESLVEAVNKNSTLKELYVANYPQEKAKHLVAAVKNDREDLDLSETDMDDFGLYFLADMIQKVKKLESLSLHTDNEKKKITKASVEALHKAVAGAQTLKKLFMSKKHVLKKPRDDGPSQQEETLSASKSEGSNEPQGDGLSPQKEESRPWSLQSVTSGSSKGSGSSPKGETHKSKRGPDEKEKDPLEVGLLKACRKEDVEELDLGALQVGNFGAFFLAETLKNNEHLETLKLGDNHIDNDGAKALADALKQNEKLKELHLISNKITDDGAESLADALKANKKLQKLWLAGNHEINVGAKFLAEALKENKTLQELRLDFCCISDENATDLVEVIMQNDEFQTLYLMHNELGGETKKQLKEKLHVHLEECKDPQKVKKKRLLLG